MDPDFKPRPYRPQRFYLEGAADAPFFFIESDHSHKVSIRGFNMEWCVFEIHYEHRSYVLAFRYGKPCITRIADDFPIRISELGYGALYRLAEVLMHATLAGFRDSAYVHKYRAHQWIFSGGSFHIRRVSKRSFTVALRKAEYEFRQEPWGELTASAEAVNLDENILSFLFRFARIVMEAYRPYERKEGEVLPPLPLLPNLEDGPVRKVRQMRTARKRQELARLGKPSHGVLKEERSLGPVTPDLFSHSPSRT